MDDTRHPASSPPIGASIVGNPGNSLATFRDVLNTHLVVSEQARQYVESYPSPLGEEIASALLHSMQRVREAMRAASGMLRG